MYDTLQVNNVLENNIYIFFFSRTVNMYDTLQVKNALENSVSYVREWVVCNLPAIESECVECAVQTGSLYIIRVIFRLQSVKYIW